MSDSIVEIIIPVWQEAKVLIEQRAYYEWLRTKARLIFADGGSDDLTVDLARRYGEVVNAAKGRAAQMNTAAKSTQAEYLLFLHADTYVTEEGWYELTKAIANQVDAACFTLAIEDGRSVFRFFEWVINWRARAFRVVDGDCGLLIKRKIFIESGGFDEVAKMEDILFARKLKNICVFQMLPAKILASAREWEQSGFWPTLVKYSWAYVHFWLDPMR